MTGQLRVETLVVLDSSFLIGFYNDNDAHHPTASSLMKNFLAGHWGEGLLLEYVYLEVMNVLLVRTDLSKAVHTSRMLLESEELEFIPCSDYFEDTVQSFSTQSGTKLSFTDCAIATVALKRAGGMVLTFDREFRKVAGIQLAG